MIKEEVKCFGCGKKGHKKWEYLKMKERRKEEATPLQEVWEKVKKHSRAKGLLLREATMCMKGWMISREVVTFMECRGYDYKETKTEENREQGFLQKKQLCNMWCGRCKEAWNWRDREAESEQAEWVKYSMCGEKDVLIWKIERSEKREIFYPPCRIEKKMLWWNWGGEVKQTVSRAQKGRAGITDLRKMIGTVNQKAVQKGKVRKVRQTFKPLREV